VITHRGFFINTIVGRGGQSHLLYAVNLKEGTQPMSIYTPYFYIIQEKNTGIYYAGSRWAKFCNPEELLVEDGYTTSSNMVNQLIKENGLNSFKICKIRCFETKEQVWEYETKFLSKVDARNNSRFYNKHNNDGHLNPQNMKNYLKETYGKDVTNISQTEHWKQTAIPKMRGVPKSESHKENLRKPKSENGRLAIKEARIEAIKNDPEKFSNIASNAGKKCKGALWWNNGSVSIKSRTRPSDDWVRGRIKTWDSCAPKGHKKESVICPYCLKEGGKPVMTRFHFDNCKLINNG
jgi:hypothetical protein